jgi:hypothetical protein
LALSFSHLLKLFLHLDSILSSRNYASLGDLLSILMVEYHSHGMLKILKLLVIDILDLRVADFAVLNKWKQHISCQSFHLQVEHLGDLALLQTLVDPADMLPESGIVIVLYAVIRSALQQLGDVCPLVTVDFMGVKYYYLFFVIDG